MKSSLVKILLASCLALSLSSVTIAANANCRWVRAHHYHGHYYPANKVCYGHHHRHHCYVKSNGVKVCR